MSTQYDNLMRFLRAKNNLPYTKYEKKSDNLKEPIILTDSHIESLEKGLKYQELGNLDYKETFGNYTSFQRYLKEYSIVRNQYPELLKDYIQETEDTSKVQELTLKLDEFKEKVNEKEDINIKLNNKIRELEEIIQNKDKIIQDMEQTQIESYFLDDNNNNQEEIEQLQKKLELSEINNSKLKKIIQELKMAEIYYRNFEKFLEQYCLFDEYDTIKQNTEFLETLKRECDYNNISFENFRVRYKL